MNLLSTFCFHVESAADLNKFFYLLLKWWLYERIFCSIFFLVHTKSKSSNNNKDFGMISLSGSIFCINKCLFKMKSNILQFVSYMSLHFCRCKDTMKEVVSKKRILNYKRNHTLWLNKCSIIIFFTIIIMLYSFIEFICYQ